MILPFPQEKKAIWNLKDNSERINNAINETHPQHFEQEIRYLYPRLTKYGLSMPMMEPVNTGIKEYDSTWYGYHVHFLKHLHRALRNDQFDFTQWNIDVVREADKRKKVITPH